MESIPLMFSIIPKILILTFVFILNEQLGTLFPITRFRCGLIPTFWPLERYLNQLPSNFCFF